MSVAIGAAETKKLNNDKSIVYSLHGDGELQEGQIWEAAMYASGKKVDNLIATVDYNLKQIDGTTDDVMPLGNLKDKFEAFGWTVVENKNGNNIIEVIRILREAKAQQEQRTTTTPLQFALKLHGDMIFVILGCFGFDCCFGRRAANGATPEEAQRR